MTINTRTGQLRLCASCKYRMKVTCGVLQTYEDVFDFEKLLLGCKFSNQWSGGVRLRLYSQKDGRTKGRAKTLLQREFQASDASDQRRTQLLTYDDEDMVEKSSRASRSCPQHACQIRLTVE